jgi:hypothetical protein
VCLRIWRRWGGCMHYLPGMAETLRRGRSARKARKKVKVGTWGSITTSLHMTCQTPGPAASVNGERQAVALVAHWGGVRSLGVRAWCLMMGDDVLPRMTYAGSQQAVICLVIRRRWHGWV